MAVHRPSHAPTPSMKSTADWAETAIRATTYAVPTTVPATRQKIFERMAPRAGLITMTTVVPAGYGVSSSRK